MYWKYHFCLLGSVYNCNGSVVEENLLWTAARLQNKESKDDLQPILLFCTCNNIFAEQAGSISQSKMVV